MKTRLQLSRLSVYLVIGLIVSEIIVACAGEITTPQYTLAVTGRGTGSGSVTSSPSGIDCTVVAGGARDDCTTAYDENTLVTLTAAANAGSTFDGWNGACSGTGTCQVTMTQAQSVTATFELIPPPQYQLSVDGAGTGSGGVTSDVAGISCTIAAGVTSNDCSELYDENTLVTLTAVADAGSTFDGWSGAGCSGAGTCQVNVTQALSVTATFELIPTPQYELIVAGAGTGSGGVTTDVAGISCTIAAGVASNDCSELYDENTLVTLTAAANAGSTFDGWNGACSGTGTCQVTMTQAQSVTATFELIPPPQYQLTVAGAGTGNGGVTSDVAGISCTIAAGVASNDCSELYDENTLVTLTAVADAGSTFDGWSGAGCSGAGTCQVNVTQALSVTATFELIPTPQYELIVAGAGTGSGGVTSDVAGISCTIAAGVTSNDCSELYDENTLVTLTAVANAGSTFDGWSGAGCSGTGTCQMTMTQALSVTATFELIPPPQYQLTVAGAGTGNGGVTSDVAGISCTIAAGVASNDCSELYDENTLVTLTAVANAGSTFDGWSGAGCSGTGTCQMTMTQALSVTATFELIPPPQYQLTVAGAGTGNGGVTSDVAGISCTIAAGVASNDCSELYDENTLVTLTAAANAGSTFDGWSGAGCSGSGTCQVTMTQASNVTATFELIPPPQYQLSVDGAGTGNGGVTSDVAGISCTLTAGVASNDCSELYDENTLVTLTAAADAGSTFDGWSGAGCSGTGTCQVTMTQALSVTATFELIPPPQYQLSVDGAGTGNGGVTSDVAGISCTIAAGVASNDCSELYDENTLVTLTAAADAGSTFDGWSGACSGTGNCQVTMTQALNVTATFELIPPPQYQLSVDGAGTGSGGVTSDVAGISCTIAAGVASNDCSELYDENTLVTLTAAADAGSTFDGWSGACSGTGTCQVTMTQALSVTATFELIPPPQYQLTVAGAGTGSGGVTSDVAGISCTLTAGVTSNDCSELYDENTLVTLTAAVVVGSTFDGWSGDCSGTGTCQLTMSQARSVTAAFTGCTLSTPGDADGDRLPDCVETNTRVFVSQLDTGTDPNDPDTDGDAIPDGDEVLGTVLGLDLALMGVNPLRQDILLEYDWFDDALECNAHSHRPTIGAVTMVTTAFANAPVVNADGSIGINFIHDYGQGGVFTGGSLIADADGVLDGGVNGAEFQSHKNANFDANRNGYFHYTLLPHRYNTNSGSSGQAELPGDDMIVSLYCAGSDRNVAHTIMHELGHNLNIRHGGFENTNYKPNYNSVMNYKYQFAGIDNDCTPPGNGVLDYSVGVRPPLDENDLDETQGVCGTPPGPGWDWNVDGDATDVGLVFDINGITSGSGDGFFGVLQDYNDWAFVILTGIGDADGAGFRLISEIVSCTNPAPVERR